MKVLFNRRFSDEQMQKVVDLGYDVLYIPEKELSPDRKDIYDIDVWFTYKGFEKVDISKMQNLKYIHLTSTGVDQVPAEYIIENGIMLSNNKTGYAIPMAESVVMYILQLYKNSHAMFNQQENRNWEMNMCWDELYSKTVGFLGTGNISKESAKRLKAFGVDIWGVNTDGRDIEYFDRCFSIDDCDEFYKNIDVLVGIMPYTEDTTHILNRDVFEMMKKGSLIINIGRGNLIDEHDLIKYMGKFRGVALDVVENEPLSPDSPLWECDNLIITPHNSWVSKGNKDRLFERLYDNLESYIKTGKPLDRVEKLERGY